MSRSSLLIGYIFKTLRLEYDVIVIIDVIKLTIKTIRDGAVIELASGLVESYLIVSK